MPFPRAKRGDQGEPVRQLQQSLKDIGLNPGRKAGEFTAATEEAVRTYQRMVGIPATGELDERTGSSLFATKPSEAGVALRRNPANPYQRHLLPDDHPPAIKGR